MHDCDAKDLVQPQKKSGCSTDKDCPSSYCQNGICHACGDACCLTDKDCPGSYCANDPTKMPPYTCHGGTDQKPFWAAFMPKMGDPPPPPAPLCFHEEDTEDHKCFEACSTEGQFQTKGIDQQGACPGKYNTVDTTKTVLQCPDGVTNVRYCQSTALNVTIATKGEAGIQMLA